MDLLENVATELGFKFHLYLVRDELFGAKYAAVPNAPILNLQSSGGSEDAIADTIAADAPAGQMARESDHAEIESDWDQSNGIQFFPLLAHNPLLGS